jgi:DNA-nicking Smr family endonuclease
MPTIFDKEGREFIEALLIPDTQRRRGMIDQWIKSTTRIMQAAVTEELKVFAALYNDEKLDEKKWRALSEGLQKQNEIHLFMDISLRKPNPKDHIKGKILPPKKRKTEIDLHGKTVSEATLLVNEFLKDNYYAHERRVLIIHGKGTGTLRGEIQKYLKQHPFVESFSMAGMTNGDEGATQVYIKEVKFS